MNLGYLMKLSQKTNKQNKTTPLKQSTHWDYNLPTMGLSCIEFGSYRTVLLKYYLPWQLFVPTRQFLMSYSDYRKSTSYISEFQDRRKAFIKGKPCLLHELHMGSTRINFTQSRIAAASKGSGCFSGPVRGEYWEPATNDHHETKFLNSA